VAFYTEQASLFQTAPKVARNAQALPREEREPMPPTQIGRALRELGIGWQAAHSPQAKGRVERSFATAQDRLVKGLRVAGAKTLEQANRYLEEEFLPWWNQHLRVAPAQAADAHRPLGPEQDLAAALSRVDTRQVSNDYTFRWEGHMSQIARASVRPGLRGGTVRVEARLDGTLAVRFRDGYLAVSLCQPRPKVTPPPAPAAAPAPAPGKRLIRTHISILASLRAPGARNTPPFFQAQGGGNLGTPLPLFLPLENIPQLLGCVPNTLPRGRRRPAAHGRAR
jgi:hypothetical protein